MGQLQDDLKIQNATVIKITYKIYPHMKMLIFLSMADFYQVCNNNNNKKNDNISHLYIIYSM